MVVKKVFNSKKVSFNLFSEMVEFLKSTIRTGLFIDYWYGSSNHTISFKPFEHHDEIDVVDEINHILSNHPKFKSIM